MRIPSNNLLCLSKNSVSTKHFNWLSERLKQKLILKISNYHLENYIHCCVRQITFAYKFWGTCLVDSEVKLGWVRRTSMSPLDSAPMIAKNMYGILLVNLSIRQTQNQGDDTHRRVLLLQPNFLFHCASYSEVVKRVQFSVQLFRYINVHSRIWDNNSNWC